MDEFDLMAELYGDTQEDDEPHEDDEIQLNMRDHRSDDAFERMLAELNGKYTGSSAPRQSRTSAITVRGEKNAPEEVLPELPAEEVPPEPPQETQETVPPPAPEPEEIEERPAPPPQIKRKPRPEKKSPEQLEMERRERERKAEQELFERREREAKEREQQFIEKIANIWNTPEFAEGGRVQMNIRTDQRKEIRITLPDLPRSETEDGNDLDYTPLIPSPAHSKEDEQHMIEEAARKKALDRTEKAASKKISIKKRRK